MKTILGLILMVAVACCAWDHIDQRAIAPTADNPCGNIGVVCLNEQGNPNGYCCYEGETCGGGKYSVGCPANACCNIRGLGSHPKVPMDGGAD